MDQLTEERILAQLASGPRTTAVLAETLLGNKKFTQPINHLLYPMEKKRLVVKVSAKPPTWALFDRNTPVTLSEEQEQILAYLRQHPESSPQSVAAGLQIEKRVANRVLTQLLNLGQAVKKAEANGSKPRWSAV